MSKRTLAEMLTRAYCGDSGEALEAAIRRAAEVARSVRNGFTATIRASVEEPELIRDPDGPWVLNSDVADAILRDARLEQ